MCDRYDTSVATSKMRSFVLLDWTVSPLMRHSSPMDSRSPSSSGVTRTGPSGVKPAKDLPKLNWGAAPPAICTSRAEKSCAAVMPATWSHAWSRATRLADLPVTTATSTSQSTWSVGRSRSPYGEATELGNLVKTSGTSGSGRPLSSAWAR